MFIKHVPGLKNWETYLCLLACRAATKDLHSCLFWASVYIVPQVWCGVFSSPFTVQCGYSCAGLFSFPSFIFYWWPLCLVCAIWVDVLFLIARWTGHNSGIISSWCLYCTWLSSKCYLAFVRCFWPCWVNSWCQWCQLLHHVWLFCLGRWSLQLWAGLFHLLGFGMCRISKSIFIWLIFRRTCCAKFLRKEVVSCICWCVCKSKAMLSVKSTSSID